MYQKKKKIKRNYDMWSCWFLFVYLFIYFWGVFYWELWSFTTGSSDIITTFSMHLSHQYLVPGLKLDSHGLSSTVVYHDCLLIWHHMFDECSFNSHGEILIRLFITLKLIFVCRNSSFLITLNLQMNWNRQLDERWINTGTARTDRRFVTWLAKV